MHHNKDIERRYFLLLCLVLSIIRRHTFLLLKPWSWIYFLKEKHNNVILMAANPLLLISQKHKYLFKNFLEQFILAKIPGPPRNIKWSVHQRKLSNLNPQPISKCYEEQQQVITFLFCLVYLLLLQLWFRVGTVWHVCICSGLYRWVVLLIPPCSHVIANWCCWWRNVRFWQGSVRVSKILSYISPWRPVIVFTFGMKGEFPDWVKIHLFQQ